MYGTKAYQWTEYGQNWMLSFVHEYFGPYWHQDRKKNTLLWRCNFFQVSNNMVKVTSLKNEKFNL